MKQKTKFLISFFVFGAIGALYTFTPLKIIRKLNLGFNLRHNDHVMIGTIALIIAIVSLYKISKNSLFK